MTPAPKYLRLFCVDPSGSHRSAYGFIRLEDGALLKADSWKRPALNRARGNLFDPSSWGCAGPYSIR